MKTSKLLLAILSMVMLTVLSAEARPPLLFLANFKGTASGTNDDGAVKSFPFPGKNLVAIDQEVDGFATAKGLALVYDFDERQLSVANVTNLGTHAFLNFNQIGDSVDSADGTARRRVMSISLTDMTFVGTAVFIERFKVDATNPQAGYSLQATFQLALPEDDSSSLGADRQTIITGKFTASKELVAQP